MEAAGEGSSVEQAVRRDWKRLRAAAGSPRDGGIDADTKRRVLRQLLEPFMGTLVVTPKEIDVLIEDAAWVVAAGLNAAPAPGNGCGAGGPIHSLAIADHRQKYKKYNPGSSRPLSLIYWLQRGVGGMRQLQGLMPSSPPILRRRVRRRLPAQLLRNLGLFTWRSLPRLGYWYSPLPTRIWLRRQLPEFGQVFTGCGTRALRTLPGLFSNLQFTPELSRSILAEGLPNVPTAYQAASGQLAPETLRSIVEAVTDYDLAEPESLVAGAFPGSRSGREPLRWDWIIQRESRDTALP